MAGTPKPIGRVLLIGRGDYDSTRTYDMLDWVRHNGKSWVCQVNGTVGVEPVEGINEWILQTIDGYIGKDGRGISQVTEDIVGKLHNFKMEYTDGSTPFEFTIKDGNDGSGGGGGGGDMTKAVYDKTDNGMVDIAEELYDITNNKKANTIVLAKLSESGSGQLEYDGKAIGGAVDIDDATIKKNTSSGAIYVPIDEKTIAINSNKLEVPLDSSTLEYDSSSKKVKVASSLTAKLAIQIPSASISGDTVTFTDERIGSSDMWLASVYCSDIERYMKSRSVSGNTLTVVYDSSVVGTTCVLQLYKEGV